MDREPLAQEVFTRARSGEANRCTAFDVTVRVDERRARSDLGPSCGVDVEAAVREVVVAGRFAHVPVLQVPERIGRFVLPDAVLAVCPAADAWTPEDQMAVAKNLHFAFGCECRVREVELGEAGRVDRDRETRGRR